MRIQLLGFVCPLVFQKYKCKRKVSEVEFVSILNSESGMPSNRMFGLLDMRILSLWAERNRRLLVFLPKRKGILFLNDIYLFMFVTRWTNFESRVFLICEAHLVFLCPSIHLHVTTRNTECDSIY